MPVAVLLAFGTKTLDYYICDIMYSMYIKHMQSIM